MVSEFYIDESGNTGDLSKVSSGAYFTEQRMFALAGYGCDLDQTFNEEVLALKKEHRLQAPEIKSLAVYNRPHFILDLLNLLDARDCPVFIELVDKHYFVAMHIIDRMLLPYTGDCDLSPQSFWVKRQMADHLAIFAPIQYSQSYAECCQTADHKTIRDLFKKIIKWADECPVQPIEVAWGIAHSARDSLKSFRKLNKLKAVARALPDPDSNPAGRLLYILPNLTSFTNMYARINRFARKQVNHVTMYHDEQVQFGDILQANKVKVEGLVERGHAIELDSADYAFSQSADLKFLKSEASIGIQVADVLAGFITRYVQDAIWGEGAMHKDKLAVFARLMCMGNREPGTGINWVAPERLMLALGVQPKSSALERIRANRSGLS